MWCQGQGPARQAGPTGLNLLGLHQGSQGHDMFAAAMTQKAQAFAGAIAARTHVDMIKDAQAERVYGKSSAADLARNLLKEIVRGDFTGGDAKNTGLLSRRRRQQANQMQRFFLCHGISYAPPWQPY